MSRRAACVVLAPSHSPSCGTPDSAIQPPCQTAWMVSFPRKDRASTVDSSGPEKSIQSPSGGQIRTRPSLSPQATNPAPADCRRRDPADSAILPGAPAKPRARSGKGHSPLRPGPDRRRPPVPRPPCRTGHVSAVGSARPRRSRSAPLPTRSRSSPGPGLRRVWSPVTHCVRPGAPLPIPGPRRPAQAQVTAASRHQPGHGPSLNSGHRPFNRYLQDGLCIPDMLGRSPGVFLHSRTSMP